ncbi:TauD/TfdA dioxygenase family protein [Novosphingobium sp. JCM 18896]|uniref:TauD/TfdA dioxygenase family protein n=1 Tax=Novosphingobium sp. JCM 18896 TaxID=2989731 RepID=UPI0022221FFD|nr:TauD/TfdA family dioxygenase [Novosphingobium sp. JCM 18896]MCW1431267.1 TauD/TfdA family dioxygenase [Novosphingobium sp. JCM 18896]
MASEAAHRLDYRTIKPTIGAEVLADKPALLSGTHAADLRALLEERGVLVFPRVDFSEAELVAFTRTLGAYAPDRKDEGVTPISIDPAGGRSADYTRASFFWHFDGYMNAAPILASILCAKVLSASGGETEFCNTYAAWEALPEDRKRQIEGLQVVHAMAGAQRAVDPEPSYETLQQWLRVPRRTLPLVWTHRSGRRSLVIGNTAVNVVGMDPLESFELLVWLRDWATQERFRHSHAWSLGDAVMWDNTGTLHRVRPYPADSGRLMIRTKLAGEEPLG